MVERGKVPGGTVLEVRPQPLGVPRRMKREAYDYAFWRDLAQRINYSFLEAPRKREARRFLLDLAEVMSRQFTEPLRRA